ncbi:ejaculatory bulb-specific protein 3-like [Leptopilina heterotoma]|uniref:ejaculatory bulb-specific protein 3-like n=1 Tax=Leptopilina heterotoma TaxID=63436 RepID=UPI001CA916C3|nr:ejaculatory bulb-specific protein 3-like [Leptopilina heterotoma]
MKTALYLTTFCIGFGTIFAQINPLMKGINIDEILRDFDRRNNIISCFLDETECDAITQNIKILIPSAIKTKCEKCPIPVKMYALKFITYLQKNDSENWSKFLAKYDSSGEDIKNFLEQVSKIRVRN